MLFTVYASSLLAIIQKQLIEVHGYADDDQLYLAFRPDNDDEQTKALKSLEACIVDVKHWMLINRLKMNDSKTDFIIVGGS